MIDTVFSPVFCKQILTGIKEEVDLELVDIYQVVLNILNKSELRLYGHHDYHLPYPEEEAQDCDMAMLVNLADSGLILDESGIHTTIDQECEANFICRLFAHGYWRYINNGSVIIQSRYPSEVHASGHLFPQNIFRIKDGNMESFVRAIRNEKNIQNSI